MKEQIDLKKQKKVKLTELQVATYSIFTVLTIIVVILIGYMLFHTEDKKTNNNKDIKHYYVDVYGYFNKNNEIAYDYVGRLEVEENGYISHYLQDKGITVDRNNKVYLYDNTVEEKIKKENEEAKKYKKCLKTKNKSKCKMNYSFTDELKEYDYLIPINSDLTIIVDVDNLENPK